MAETLINGDWQAEIEGKGYLSVCDPCVGAGALLIAAANVIKRQGLITRGISYLWGRILMR